MATNYLSRFSIPTVEKCCCLQLKTGGIIIACIWLIPITLLTVFAGWEMIAIAISRGRIQTTDRFVNFTEELETMENWHDANLVQIASVESGFLVLLATCILHIYGAIKEKRVLMIPFMTVVGFFDNIVISGEIMRLLLLTSSLAGFLISVTLEVAGAFSLLILLSYYRQLQLRPPSNKEDDDDILEAIEGAL